MKECRVEDYFVDVTEKILNIGEERNMMDQPTVDTTIKEVLQKRFSDLENHLKGDLLFFNGALLDELVPTFIQVIEDLADDEKKADTLYFMIRTTGGSVTCVERLVNIIRHHYREIKFIVPDYAYSAGTILCMSGDEIMMDYSSVLGPIDPQVRNREGRYVPALGYLDKVEEFLSKAKENKLTTPEFLILKEMDLAELKKYEQAKELTITLLKKWLVKYKFKNWDTHRTTSKLIGTPVTSDQKIKRAEEIADKLSDNKLWKSHGRPIDIATLENDLKLQVVNYTGDKETKNMIGLYFTLAIDYLEKKLGFQCFWQTRRFL